MDKSKDDHITIKDPIIEPYYIKVEELQYIIYKDNGKDYQDLSIGHYTNFINVLNQIAYLKNYENLKSQTIDLKTYMNEYKEMQNKFINLIPIIKP